MDEKVSPPVEIYKHDNRAIKNMSYMQETDAWLDELLAVDEEADDKVSCGAVETWWNAG